MRDKVGIRELRQYLSRYLERVKRGEDLEVTERGRVVARLSPAGEAADGYAELAARLGATTPIERLEAIVARQTGEPMPEGTTDALLFEGREERPGA